MPNTLEENVNRIKAARTAIANAITAKGGTVASGDGLEDFANDIATIPSGGGGGESTIKNDVTFYDYDGTIVASYTASEFASLSAMPSNPSHTGLTAQGWNWTLADAKAYVAKYGKLNIGQMYVTSDGKTRIYIELPEGRLSPWLKLYLDANSELDIDWGDGSAHSTFTSTTAEYKNEQHAYAAAGNYLIAITVVSGGFSVRSTASSLSTLLTDNNASATSPDRAYLNSIKKIEVGTGITSIKNQAFSYCTSLKSITIPDSVISIGTGAFQYCASLDEITIPDAVTSIGTNAFSSCYSLNKIAIPDTVTSIELGAFYYCYSLNEITIPDAVTSIKNAFSSCHSLSSITIPDTVTSIGNKAFSSCYSLSSITINKQEDSISGSPWGATTDTPTSTQIIWTG